MSKSGSGISRPTRKPMRSVSDTFDKEQLTYRRVNITVEEQIFMDAKYNCLVDGEPFSRLVTRLLKAYNDGKAGKNLFK